MTLLPTSSSADRSSRLACRSALRCSRAFAVGVKIKRYANGAAPVQMVRSLWLLHAGRLDVRRPVVRRLHGERLPCHVDAGAHLGFDRVGNLGALVAVYSPRRAPLLH